MISLVEDVSKSSWAVRTSYSEIALTSYGYLFGHAPVQAQRHR